MTSGYQSQIVNKLNTGITALKGVTAVYNGLVEFDKIKNHKNEINVFIYCDKETFSDPYESAVLTSDISAIVRVLWTGDVDIRTSDDLLAKEIEIDELIKTFLFNFPESEIDGCQKCYLASKDPYISDSRKLVELVYRVNFNLIIA